MVFSSLTFLTIFFPIVLALYFVKNSIKWRNAVLLTASLVFYAWGEPLWILGMVASAFVNWLCADAIATTKKQGEKRMWLIIGVGFSAALLFACKYAAFFANSFLQLFGLAARVPVMALPIGISFYTFQIITYTVDVYREETPAQKSFARLLLYVSCFPQLIAGPIVRYSDVAKQIGKRKTTPVDFYRGMQKFSIGLGKKVIFANICGAAMTQLPLSGTGLPLSVTGAWYGAFLYALQIYFDFSGYSDMAIGVGRILGFTYRENFDYPFLALGVGDFWRRWHISLGDWFREYLMYPLMRSNFFRRLSMKKSPKHGKMFYRNLTAILCTLIVWSFTGLWHGASWNFILWGVYFGVLHVLEKFAFGKILSKTPNAVKWCLNMFVALVSFIIFYYTDISNVFHHLGSMFGLTGGGFIDDVSLRVIQTYSVFPLIAFAFSMPLAKIIEKRAKRFFKPAVCEAGRSAFMVVCFVLSVLFLVGQSFNPFIYFQF